VSRQRMEPRKMTDKREYFRRDVLAAGRSVIAMIEIEAPVDDGGEFRCVVGASPDCPAPHRIAILRAATDLLQGLNRAEHQDNHDKAE
jgi:hypothetical protein